MKKLLFALSAAVMFMMTACGQKGFTIEGDIQGVEGTVKLQDGDEVIAEAPAVEGKFSMKGELEGPGVFYLYSDAGRLALILLEPGDKLTMSGWINMDERSADVKTTGSAAHDSMQKFNDRSKELGDRYRSGDSETRQAVLKEREQLVREYMNGNMGNMYGAYLLYNSQRNMQPSDILEKIGQLPSRLQQAKIISDLKQTTENKLRTEPGNPYIEIVLPDKDGNEVALSSLIGPGKYVLIDFWASWCGPCMGELPYLLPAYEKYHMDGFEIYGISLDSDRDKWLGAIEANDMDWVHVSLLKHWDNPYVKEYAVSGIPASFLIGPDGTIVAKNLRGANIEKTLSELIK